MCRRHTYRRAFTLVESAILLMLAGIVLAGIFFAADYVSQQERLNNATTQKDMVVDNLRNLYRHASTSGANALSSPPTGLMATLDRAGIFPDDMQNNPNANDGVINHGLSSIAGTVTASYILPTGTDPFLVTLTFRNLLPRDCNRLLMRGTVNSSDQTALYRLIVNGTSNTVLPIKPVQAEQQCRSASNESTITWHYRVR